VFWLFLAACVGLGYAGSQPPEGTVLIIGQVCTFYYFFHLVILMPLLGWFERPLPLPASIGAPVLKGGGALAGASAAKPMETA
jgi:quinol-cytochrome oxidoreductase complex cytochrome b subunit